MIAIAVLAFFVILSIVVFIEALAYAIWGQR